jgi:hypothetical protein
LPDSLTEIVGDFVGSQNPITWTQIVLPKKLTKISRDVAFSNQTKPSKANLIIGYYDDLPENNVATYAFQYLSPLLTSGGAVINVGETSSEVFLAWLMTHGLGNPEGTWTAI